MEEVNSPRHPLKHTSVFAHVTLPPRKKRKKKKRKKINIRRTLSLSGAQRKKLAFASWSWHFPRCCIQLSSELCKATLAHRPRKRLKSNRSSKRPHNGSKSRAGFLSPFLLFCPNAGERARPPSPPSPPTLPASLHLIRQTCS